MRRNLTTAALACLAASLASVPATASDRGPGDAAIAHIAYTAGEIDIRYAHLALATSDNADVRDFAGTMLRDHKAVNDAALALLGKLKVAPQDNATSQSLLESASAKRAELKSLAGADFDRAYAANELAYHQFVNKTVKETLIPAAQNQEFKALLGGALKTFQTHEKHAAMMVEKNTMKGASKIAFTRLRAFAAGLVLLAACTGASAEDHVVEMRGLEFVPAVLDVRVGDTITWVNADLMPHTATAGDGAWDSGNLDGGAEWSLVIEQAGSVDYMCAYHPGMTGSINAK